VTWAYKRHSPTPTLAIPSRPYRSWRLPGEVCDELWLNTQCFVVRKTLLEEKKRRAADEMG